MRRNYSDPHTLRAAIKNGDLSTRLSLVLCGAGNILHKQVGKGILFLGTELIYLCYMMLAGISCIAMLPSLGWLKQEEVWNESKGIYEYTQGHNSVLILLYGVVAICISVL